MTDEPDTWPLRVLIAGGHDHYATGQAQTLSHAINAGDWDTVRVVAADPWTDSDDVDYALLALADANETPAADPEALVARVEREEAKRALKDAWSKTMEVRDERDSLVRAISRLISLPPEHVAKAYNVNFSGEHGHIRQPGAWRHNLCEEVGGQATSPCYATCSDCRRVYAGSGDSDGFSEKYEAEQRARIELAALIASQRQDRVYGDDVERYARFVAGHLDAQIDERHRAAARAVLGGLVADGRLLRAEPGRAVKRAAVIDAAHLARQRDFSARTFGPDARTDGLIDHIRKELDEIAAAPRDLSEWVDVVILALDGAWRSGHEPQEIIDAIVAKQARNEARTWPDWRTVEPGKAIEHDRTVEQQPQGPSASPGYVLACPGVFEYGRGLTAMFVHNGGCCEEFAAAPQVKRESRGLRIPRVYLREDLAP